MNTVVQIVFMLCLTLVLLALLGSRSPKSKKNPKKVKTVSRLLNCADDFDKEINDLLEEGWTLTERIAVDLPETPARLIAFLEK